MSISMNRKERRDLLAAALDLQHSLGRGLSDPLLGLDRRSDAQDIREAARRALLETGSGADGPRAARDLWARFRARYGARLAGLPDLGALEEAVEAALSWEARLDDPGVEIDRHDLRDDLGSVGDAIRDLVLELHG